MFYLNDDWAPVLVATGVYERDDSGAVLASVPRAGTMVCLQ